MRTIDLQDLPEPVAKAIESMVQALREEAAHRPDTSPGSKGVGEFDRAMDELFAADARSLPASSLTYRRDDIYIDHD